MTGSVTDKAVQVDISADHSRLVTTDPESIRSFLRRSEQYSNTVLARAKQLSSSDVSTLTTETVRPADLKFCIDVEFFESFIALGFIETATAYASLRNEQIREFLDGRCEGFKDVVTLEALDSIVKFELRTNMKNSTATACMQDLFRNCHTILSRNGLK